MEELQNLSASEVPQAGLELGTEAGQACKGT